MQSDYMIFKLHEGALVANMEHLKLLFGFVETKFAHFLNQSGSI